MENGHGMDKWTKMEGTAPYRRRHPGTRRPKFGMALSRVKRERQERSSTYVIQTATYQPRRPSERAGKLIYDRTDTADKALKTAERSKSPTSLWRSCCSVPLARSARRSSSSSAAAGDADRLPADEPVGLSANPMPLSVIGYLAMVDGAVVMVENAFRLPRMLASPASRSTTRTDPEAAREVANPDRVPRS